MVRTFVAVALPDALRARIGGVAEALRESRARLSFVDPALIHVTLAFLGEVPPERLPAVAGALAGVRQPPFEVRVGPIAGDGRREPRTLWCPCTGNGSLAGLAAGVARALEPLGFTPERRPFRGHATVARVRSFHPSLGDLLADLPPDGFGAFTVDRFRLKQSTLTPSGPIYDDLSEVLL